MGNKKTVSQIKKHWQAYELASPYGVETILFKDLEECRSPETRARYVDMLAMFLEQFGYQLESGYRGSYHYKIRINSDYSLYFSFSVYKKFGYVIHARLDEKYEKDEAGKEKWQKDISILKQRSNISNSGKCNFYISFQDKKDLDENWDWRFQSVIEDYKEIVNIINNELKFG